MVAGGDETDWERGIGGGEAIEMVGTGSGGVMHRTASLTILLIINIETNCVSLLQLEEGRAVREDGAVFKETNVLSSELYSTCSGPRGRHGVFTRPQKEKESNSE